MTLIRNDVRTTELARLAPPDLRYREQGERHLGVAQMAAAGIEQAWDFGFGQESELDYCASERFHHGRQIVDQRVDGANSDQEGSILNVFQAGAAGESIETPCQLYVAAHVAECSKISCLQPLPGG